MRTYLLLFLCLLQSGCGFDESVVVRKEIQTVECTTPGKLVSNLCEDEISFLKVARENYPIDSLSEINITRLQQIGKKHQDMDVAAAVFYNAALNDARNSKYLGSIKDNKLKPSDISSLDRIKLLFVPGMFYRDNPETGADGASIRSLAKKHGLYSELIPIDQSAPADENAKVICSFLKNESGEKYKYYIVSASKGSLDFRRAIEFCGKEEFFQAVHGWLTIGGIQNGSRIPELVENDLYNELRGRFYFFLNGYQWEGFRSLAVDRKLKKESIPSHLKITSVVAVPFFRHVTTRAKPYYLYLSRYGPNDGMVLLADSYVKGYPVFPVFRNDHYFAWPIDEHDMTAILFELIARHE